MTILAGILALLIGLAMGMLGGGGSILTVPVFVYVMGIEPRQAIAMSLLVVGSVALTGAIRRRSMGHLRLEVALPFGAAAMLGAFGGAQLAKLLTPTQQMLLFAVVMLVSATSMLRTRELPAVEEQVTARRGTLIAVGLGVGILTGLVGIGGGFLIVPALVLLGGLPMREAVGTSLLVISMNAAAGFAGYLGAVTIPWVIVLTFGGLATLGLFAGTSFSRHVPQRELKRLFAILLYIVGAFILWQNRALF